VVLPEDGDTPSPDAYDGSSIFDMPSVATSSEATTPLTPPETGESVPDKLPEVAESPLLRKSSKSAIPFQFDLTGLEGGEFLLQARRKNRADWNVAFKIPQIKEIKSFAGVSKINLSFTSEPSTSSVSKSQDPSSNAEKHHPNQSPSSEKKGTDKEKGKKETAFQKSLEQIIPKSVHQRLSECQKTCVGSKTTKQTVRCRNKKAISSRVTLVVLPSLAKATKEKDYVEILGTVKDVIYSTMCHVHSGIATSPDKFSMLENLIKGLADTTHPLSFIELEQFNSWISAIFSLESECEVPKIEITLPSDEKPGEAKRPEAGSSEAIYTQVRKAIPPFTLYESKNLDKLSTFTALEKLASRPLGVSDMDPGFIYILWFEGKFGHIKIGRSKDPQKRIKRWKSKCGRDIKDVHTAIDLVKVPHVNRVEKLMDAELYISRRALKCTKCGTNHNEWFHTSQDLAVAIFDKWKDWILQSPYEEDPSTHQWTLRPTFKETLEVVCKPVKLDTKPQNRPRLRRPSIRKAPGFVSSTQRNH
jgi:hypothetical protein